MSEILNKIILDDMALSTQVASATDIENFVNSSIEKHLPNTKENSSGNLVKKSNVSKITINGNFTIQDGPPFAPSTYTYETKTFYYAGGSAALGGYFWLPEGVTLTNGVGALDSPVIYRARESDPWTFTQFGNPNVSFSMPIEIGKTSSGNITYSGTITSGSDAVTISYERDEELYLLSSDVIGSDGKIKSELIESSISGYVSREAIDSAVSIGIRDELRETDSIETLRTALNNVISALNNLTNI
jgi:hypothetical protein